MLCASIYVSDLQLKPLYILFRKRKVASLRNFNFLRATTTTTTTTTCRMHEVLRWENNYFKGLEFCGVTDNIKIFDFRYFCSIKTPRYQHTHVAYEVTTPYRVLRKYLTAKQQEKMH
jgi:hypothetical protein